MAPVGRVKFVCAGLALVAVLYFSVATMFGVGLNPTSGLKNVVTFSRAQGKDIPQTDVHSAGATSGVNGADVHTFHAALQRQREEQDVAIRQSQHVLQQQIGELHKALEQLQRNLNDITQQKQQEIVNLVQQIQTQQLPSPSQQQQHPEQQQQQQGQALQQSNAPKKQPPPQLGQLPPFTSTEQLHPDVHVVPSEPDPNLVLPHKDCVPLPKSPKAGVKICIHPIGQDRWVSGSFKQGKLWEEGLIIQMKEALIADSTMSVIDLGSNIGEYALFAAAMGRPVLAVEMLPGNVNLVQTSFKLSGLSERVLIVNNAVYSDHRTLETKFMAGNMGGSRLNTSKVYEALDHSRKRVSVRTICLDDLSPFVKGRTLYVKMDIENSEHKALECASKFFQVAKVKVVQMEWLHRTGEESKTISAFMTSNGFVPSRRATHYQSVPATSMGGQDVFFLNKKMFNIS